HGYLGQPALTAERFVPDPFGPPGARVYRTGDMVRYGPDGELEFLGRVDYQVKLRGFRIELGEVEAAVRAHPTVRECVVLLRDDQGDRRLVAYVIPAVERSPGAAEVRSFLKERLPEYMVPAAVVVLDRFPTTTNGKVDRAALPRPDAASADERTYA